MKNIAIKQICDFDSLLNYNGHVLQKKVTGDVVVLEFYDVF
jgi:hypothetical protein